MKKYTISEMVKVEDIFQQDISARYTITNSIYYCIFHESHESHTSHTATVSNTLVSPKYPAPNKALTKTSPRIL